ncbi:reverse transcriptase domain-containing protein, partial [Tanacetum coccineum]
MSLRTTILGQMSEIKELHDVDHKRQAVTSEMLKADHRRSAEMRELRTADRVGDSPIGTGGSITGIGHITTKTARDANRNGDDSHTSRTGGRRTECIIREYTYQDFMKCKPLYFKGTKGVVELIQWFERIETVFRISNCLVENQVKFSTCTLLAGALTWWNSHVMTVSHDAAYAMTWTHMRKKMTDKYCPRNEMKKLKAELWNLKVKGTCRNPISPSLHYGNKKNKMRRIGRI